MKLTTVVTLHNAAGSATHQSLLAKRFDDRCMLLAWCHACFCRQAAEMAARLEMLTWRGKFLNMVKPATKVVQMFVPTKVENAKRCRKATFLLGR